MNASWTKKQLRDLIEIKHGFAFKGEFFTEQESDNILLTPGNFAIGGGFKDDKFKYYVGNVPQEYILKNNDLIVTMTDLSKNMDTLGFPALVPKTPTKRYLHNQRLGKINIRKPDFLDYKYLYYLLCTSEYRNEIKASSSGSVIRHTSPERILKFDFLLPSLYEQRAIADVLSALDDKIELNRRMNQTLEQLAQNLYKYWFIDNPERVNWEEKTLPEIIDVNPLRVLQSGVEAPYLDMANIPTQGHRAKNWFNREFRSGSKFINGDTLLARITPCLENGKTAYVDFLEDGQIGWGSTEFIVLRPKVPLPSEFGYFLARSNEFRDFAIQNMSGTSGRQRVPNSCFANYLLSNPPEQLSKNFGAQIKDIMIQIKENDNQLRTLRELRDTLLPKLMSGQIQVHNQEY